MKGDFKPGDHVTVITNEDIVPYEGMYVGDLYKGPHVFMGVETADRYIDWVNYKDIVSFSSVSGEVDA